MPSSLAGIAILAGITPALTPTPAALARQATDAPRSSELPLTVSGPLGTHIDAFVRDSLEHPFHGQLLVEAGGEVVLHQAYGLAGEEAGTRMSPATLLDIGSITKPVTAMAVMRLVEDGRIRTDEPLGGFIPDLPPVKAGITLEQLLTHTAGLPQASGDDFDGRTAESFLAWFRRVELLSEPGTEWSYSNPGFSLLAMVIERVTGKPFEHFVRDEVLGPAGAWATGYVLPDWTGRPVAVGYRRGERWGTPLERRWLDDGPGWNLRANGGLLSTASDLYRWVTAFEDGLIVSPETRDRMLEHHVILRGSGQGYAWRVSESDSGRLVRHSGSNLVFWADVRWYVDRDVKLILLTSRYDQDALREVLWGVLGVLPI